MKTHTFRILRTDGAVDVVRYRVSPLDYDGSCDPPHGMADREIVLDESVGDRDFLRIALHEAMHALHWHKAEATVDHDSKQLARWLWRLGYRRQQ